MGNGTIREAIATLAFFGAMAAIGLFALGLGA